MPKKDIVGPASTSNSGGNYKIKARYLVRYCIKKKKKWGWEETQFIEKSIKLPPQPVLYHFKPQQFAMAYTVDKEILSHKSTVRYS